MLLHDDRSRGTRVSVEVRGKVTRFSIEIRNLQRAERTDAGLSFVALALATARRQQTTTR